MILQFDDDNPAVRAVSRYLPDHKGAIVSVPQASCGCWNSYLFGSSNRRFLRCRGDRCEEVTSPVDLERDECVISTCKIKGQESALIVYLRPDTTL